jgi:hypothetical protein
MPALRNILIISTIISICVVLAITIIWNIVVKKTIIADGDCGNVLYCTIDYLHGYMGIVYVATFFLFLIIGFLLKRNYE